MLLGMLGHVGALALMPHHEILRGKRIQRLADRALADV